MRVRVELHQELVEKLRRNYLTAQWLELIQRVRFWLNPKSLIKPTVRASMKWRVLATTSFQLFLVFQFFFTTSKSFYNSEPILIDRSVIDKWYKSNDKDSLTMAKKMMREEGLLCGTLKFFYVLLRSYQKENNL